MTTLETLAGFAVILIVLGGVAAAQALGRARDAARVKIRVETAPLRGPQPR
jgi:hypothetical protein